MSEWLYRQAVSYAAGLAAAAHVTELSLPPEVQVRSLEDIIRDLIRTDPLLCRGLQHRGGREIAFEWSFGEEDVPVLAAAAEEHVRLSLGG